MAELPIQPQQNPAMQRISEQKQRIVQNLVNVKKKIAIISGKGGVGKTFVAVNLAFALAQAGFKVGLLDADIDCPNVHVVLGIKEELQEVGGKIKPIEKNGVKVVSMAGFAQAGSENQPRIWRGPLIGKAIADFLALSDWGALDFLVIDMPPGTSDAALTLMQFLDLDGVVVVATSSPAAVLDAQKAVLMTRELNQPVLGLLENMSGDVFGRGTIKTLAHELNVPFLGAVSLQSGVSDCAQNGLVPVLSLDTISEEFQSIVDNVSKLVK